MGLPAAGKQGRKWLPNTGWASSNVARGGVPPPPVGAFYSTKIWVGNCPPCPPVTDPPVRNRFCEKYVASILTETKKNY